MRISAASQWTRIGARYLPFADAATEELPLGRLLRLSLFQVSVGLAVVLLIAVSAVRYRQDIAVIWPQSAGVYSRLRLKVNASGIDFRQVDYKRETDDGQVELAV